MERKKIINKVVITADAEFDYESEFRCRMPKMQMKEELEEYIFIRLSNFNGYYFRIKFFDEQTNQMLMLFVYKGDSFSCMQIWNVRGVCREEDWTNDLEDDGQIRCWLKSKIEPLETADWVWDLRISKAIQQKELALQLGEDMESYMQEIKVLLKNYRINKARISVGNSRELVELKDYMAFLDNCINQLDAEANAVITLLYVHGQSIRKVGSRLGYSKSAIEKKKNRALQIIEILFADRSK